MVKHRPQPGWWKSIEEVETVTEHISVAQDGQKEWHALPRATNHLIACQCEVLECLQRARH